MSLFKQQLLEILNEKLENRATLEELIDAGILKLSDKNKL